MKAWSHCRGQQVKQPGLPSLAQKRHLQVENGSKHFSGCELKQCMEVEAEPWAFFAPHRVSKSYSYLPDCLAGPQPHG